MARNAHVLLLLGLMLIPGMIRAQGVQNMDVFFLWGVDLRNSQPVGAAVTLDESKGFTQSFGYGYQILRTSAASLWVEVLPVFSNTNNASTPGVFGTANLDWWAFIVGGRFMIPLQSRISAYGAVGGGPGYFHIPVISDGSNPFLTSLSTTHGVFEFGGGLDIRLNRRISIRGEVRDFVTGAGLSGVTGRNHVVVLGGLAVHF